MQTAVTVIHLCFIQYVCKNNNSSDMIRIINPDYNSFFRLSYHNILVLIGPFAKEFFSP